MVVVMVVVVGNSSPLFLHDREPGFLSASTGLLNFRRNSGREIRFSHAVPRNLLLD